MKVKWNKKMQRALDKIFKDAQKTRQLLKEKLNTKKQTQTS